MALSFIISDPVCKFTCLPERKKNYLNIVCQQDWLGVTMRIKKRKKKTDDLLVRNKM